MSASLTLPAAVSAPAAKVRDPLLDNAKYVALVLVVVGHAVQALRDVGVVADLYFFLHTFHIGVFVALAGYHSKHPFSWSRLGRLALAIVVPYAIFEYAYESVLGWADGYEPHHDLLAPNWLMWFLMALFLWRATAPWWRRLPAPLAVTAAVAVSLLAGLSGEDRLAMVKTLGLLPFFVIGLHLQAHHLVWLRRRAVRASAAALGVVALAACLLWSAPFDVDWLRWRYSYAELGVTDVGGMLARLALIGLGLALAGVFYSLLPDGRTWFTSLGGNTMHAYLLHGFGVKLALGLGVWELAALHSPAGAALVAITASALATVLMTPAVARAVWPVTEPARLLPAHRESQVRSSR